MERVRSSSALAKVLRSSSSRRALYCVSNAAIRFSRSRTVAGGTVTDLIGDDGPVEARTEGLVVRRIAVDAGASARVDIGADRFTLGYLINGAATDNDSKVGADDAFTLNGNPTLEITAAGASDVFVVSVPSRPSYQPVRQR